jgi:hypothetical protein
MSVARLDALLLCAKKEIKSRKVRRCQRRSGGCVVGRKEGRGGII